MEFLVHSEITMPRDLTSNQVTALREAEQERASELAAAGTLVRLWRIPGRWANYGLWSVPDATALHEALSSLPLWPYMAIDVHPLAKHPNDPAQ